MRERRAAALAGAACGLCTDVLTLPFDTLRAKLNSGAASHGAAGAVAGAAGARRRASAAPGRALREVAARTLRAEGPAGLFRGLSAVVLFAPPAYALYFATYKTAAAAVEARCGGREATPAAAYFGAGLAAELAANLAYLPYDVTKQRLQVAPRRARPATALPLAAHLVRTRGARALYRGALATLATYLPFSGLYFATYEGLKARLLPAERAGAAAPPPSAAREACAHFSAAVCAGAVGAAATQPVDVIKTRLQVGGGALHAAGGTGGRAPTGPRAPTMLATLRAAVVREGWGSLLRGTYARVLSIAPGCGLSMMLFEAAFEGLHGRAGS